MNMHQKAKILFYHNFFLQNACKKQLYFFCFGKMHDFFFKNYFFFLLEEKSGRRQITKVQFSSFYKNLLGVHTNFLSILTFKKVIDMLPSRLVVVSIHYDNFKVYCKKIYINMDCLWVPVLSGHSLY